MSEEFDFPDFDFLDFDDQDFFGDLVTYPPADFMIQETSLDVFNTFDMNQNAFDMNQKSDASVPMNLPPPPPLVESSPNASSQKANSHKRKKETDPKTSAERSKALTLLPILIFKAFNGGDLPKVKDIIKEVTTKHCVLKTPALDEDIIGQQHVIDLFQVLYDTHPDAVWVAKQCKLNDEGTIIQCRVYFAGTRIVGNTKSLDLNGTDHAMYLFKKKNSSLLDEMDTSMMSTFEMDAMRELEKVSKNLSVFFKGTLDLVVEEGSDKIVKFLFDWIVTSFREADLGV